MAAMPGTVAVRAPAGAGSAWLAGGRLLPLVALASLAAVGAALVSQHRYDMLPCPWCILQRVVFLAMAAVALAGWLLGLAWRARPAHRGAAVLVLVLAGCGVAAAAWQHFVAAESTACHLTLADRIVNGLGLAEAWPEVFVAYASCADAKVNLMGLPYEAWSAALFLGLGAAAAQALRRP
jgi:disulfide bond formation protein DsbB